MLRIIPLKDKQILAELNQQSLQKADLAFCLYSGDYMEAYILYDITGDCCKFKYIMASDGAYADGLIRSVLSSMMDIGIDRATFSENIDLTKMPARSSLRKCEGEIESINELMNNYGKCAGGCIGCGGCR